MLCIHILSVLFAGGYFLRSTTTNQGKLSRRLLSPAFTVDDISCLTFYYSLQMLGKSQWAAFAVYAVTPGLPDIHAANDTGSDLLWVVQQVTDGVFHQGQAEITTGSFRLLFEVNGQAVKASLDDVLLTEGQCHNTSTYRIHVFKLTLQRIDSLDTIMYSEQVNAQQANSIWIVQLTPIYATALPSVFGSLKCL